MLLAILAVDAVGVVTLVLVILQCCLSLYSFGYLVHFRSKVHKEKFLPLKDFNSFWIARLILVLCALLWGMVELLRLPLLRKEGWLLHLLEFKLQIKICKIYLLSSSGITKPCFFLTALFLVQGSLKSVPFSSRRLNARIIKLILLYATPVFLFQFFLVIFTPVYELNKRYKVNKPYRTCKEGYGVLPYYFTQSFAEVEIENRRLAVCCYPLLSTTVLGILGCSYVWYFLYLGRTMSSFVINRTLQLRINTLVVAIALFLPFHVIFLGLTVLSPPNHTLYEVLNFMACLTILLCISLGELILVIQPVADALAVQCVFNSSFDFKMQSNTEDPEEHCLVSIGGISAGEGSSPLIRELSKGQEGLANSCQLSVDTDLESLAVHDDAAPRDARHSEVYKSISPK